MIERGHHASQKRKHMLQWISAAVLSLTSVWWGYCTARADQEQGKCCKEWYAHDDCSGCEAVGGNLALSIHLSPNASFFEIGVADGCKPGLHHGTVRVRVQLEGDEQPISVAPPVVIARLQAVALDSNQ